MNEDLIGIKLDILIKLTAANLIAGDKSQTESILKLNSMGIGYRDVAKILGASENYVAMIISKNKKKDKKKKENSNLNSGENQNGETAIRPTDE